MSSISCHLSLVSCLHSPITCLLSPVSLLLSCLPSHISHGLSPISFPCLKPPVSHLLPNISASFLQSFISCLLTPCSATPVCSVLSSAAEQPLIWAAPDVQSPGADFGSRQKKRLRLQAKKGSSRRLRLLTLNFSFQLCKISLLNKNHFWIILSLHIELTSCLHITCLICFHKRSSRSRSGHEKAAPALSSNLQ